jgi:hypothetical protein
MISNMLFDMIYLELKSCEQQYEAMQIENEEDIACYYKLKKNLDHVQEQMSVMMNEPKHLLPFLQPGRLITVSSTIVSVVEQNDKNTMTLTAIVIEIVAIVVRFLVLS